MMCNLPVEGTIVKEFYIGHTHILISDAAYSNKTPEELKRIEEEFRQQGLNLYLRNSTKESTPVEIDR